MSRPAHVLGDVVGSLTLDDTKYYRILIEGVFGRRDIVVPAQYVLLGDELEDLYADDDIDVNGVDYENDIDERPAA